MKGAPKTLSCGRLVHVWAWEGAELLPCPMLVLAVGEDGARAWGQVFWLSGAIEARWVPSAPYGEDGLQVPTEGHWTWPRSV